MWTVSVLTGVHFTMWESDVFECSVEEPPSKKRDTRSKSPAKTLAPVGNHCDCELPSSARTEENDSAAAREHLHNGLLLQTLYLAIAMLLMVWFALAANPSWSRVMKPLSILVPHLYVNIKYWYKTVVTGFIA